MSVTTTTNANSTITRLRYENLDVEHPFAGYFWKIANWNLTDGQS